MLLYLPNEQGLKMKGYGKYMLYLPTEEELQRELRREELLIEERRQAEE